MGLCLAQLLLLAEWMSLETLGAYASGGLQAALGLGLVIFVHELGHFAVAKWCGVQCDKFMIGFDIGGYKTGRQWGETYYGIGILPLGGYVKMMGQDDDPSKFAEQARESQAAAGDENAKEIIGPHGETVMVDRRSYMAKSVPQRMAIISAGVIMNVIFAFIFAFIAFGMGVPMLTCEVGSTAPGGAAWQANLRTGDRITRIGEIDNPTFQNLQSSVTLGNLEEGILFDITRADGSQIESLRLQPNKVGALPQVGVSNNRSLRVAKKIKPSKHSPAGQLTDGFQGGDVIRAIDGEPIATYGEYVAKVLARKDQPITVTVTRGGKVPIKNPFGEVTGGEEVTITLPPNPRERLGIVSVLGPIAAIQQDSPAAEAGLQVGDQLISINGAFISVAPNGEPTLDPLTIEDHLAKIAGGGESATLLVQRGEGGPLEIVLQPRVASWLEPPTRFSPLSIPSLGVACGFIPEVAALIEGSPAQSVDLQPGDRIILAQAKSGEGKELIKPIEISDEKPNWLGFLNAIQDAPTDAMVALTVDRGGKEHQVELGIQSSSDAFQFERGIPHAPLQELRAASNLNEQLAMAGTATYRSLTQVLRFLSKIGGQVPLGALGGPITIVKAGFFSASDGVGALLLFLTMLSANLAVLNFLPIPVLDGGHMVFLAYEGVRGRPANERVLITAQMFGMALLLSLMIFVFGLDLGLIDRGL